MDKERLNIWLPLGLKNALKASAVHQQTTITEVTIAALEEYLNPDDYKVASLRYLADLSRKLDVTLKREETILETIGRFVLVYLHHTPPLPPDEAPVAQREAGPRYSRFIEKLSRSLEANRTFLAAIEEIATTPEDFYFSEIDGGNDES